MSYNVEEILSSLEKEAEKTAEDAFIGSLTEETEDVSEEKVAQTEAEETTEEKVASNEETTEENTDEVEEKTASNEEVESDDDTDTEEKTASTETTSALPSERELVKMAQDFGKIAAHSLFTELAALGVAMPTNKDMAVPGISQVSRPQDSPVTVARDAKEQEAAGHDAYDKRHNHQADGTGGHHKTEKKASLVDEDFIVNFYNKIYN